jgi:hypothetical protein
MILSLLAVSCGPEQPKLEQKKMVSVLCDVMVMEAGHQVKYNYGIYPIQFGFAITVLFARITGLNTMILRRNFCG